MKLFLDTAAIDEIRTAARWGILAGVTTNPSLFADVGGHYDDVLKQIYELTPGPVSAEVVAADMPGMLREGRYFAQLARNIVVKIPMCEEGLEAIARLAREDIPTNCTLIFSANQGLSPPTPAHRSSRRSSAVSTTSTSTAWRSSVTWPPSSGPMASMPGYSPPRCAIRAT